MIGGAHGSDLKSQYTTRHTRNDGPDQLRWEYGYVDGVPVAGKRGLGLLAPQSVGLEVPKLIRPGRAINSEAAPVRVALKIQSRWGIADPDMARICGVNLNIGESLPSVIFSAIALPDISARLQALFNIYHRLSALYSTSTAERGWLNSSVLLLGNRVPIEVLTRGDMAGVLAVEDALRHLTTS